MFVSVHSARSHPGSANSRNLDELFDFAVTLTMRVTVPLDRVGDQLIARNLALVPLGLRQGFNAKLEQLRGFLHMNWTITVLRDQTINGTPVSSANDNLAAWTTGTVYGFVEPARYNGAEIPTLVGGEWMGAEPDAEDFAIKSELRFANARRFQPQTAGTGVFV